MSEFKIVKLLDPAVVINVPITPRGEYDALVEYQAGDLVTYLNGSYIARGVTLGNLPTDTAFWQLLFINEPPREIIDQAITNGTQDGILVEYDEVTNTLDFTNTDKGSIAVTSHEAALDPHPQYETGAEAQARVDAHANLTNNPHAVTASQVGLGNVDNTSDANKPVSIATQAALDLKYDASNPSGFETPTQLDARDTANRDRANHAGTQSVSTITGLAAVATSGDKADVGLGNVDNTSDLNKPISTATQTALDLKYDANNPNAFETPAQLDARDSANRARANHTGTQLAATISDFDAAAISALAPSLALKQDVFDPQFTSEFFDDFIIGLTTSLGWTLTQQGTGSGANNSTTDGANVSQKAVGVLRLDTGTTATGRTVVHRQVNMLVLGYFEIDQRWRFRLGAISSPVQRYVIYVGIHDQSGNGAPVDGVYFVYADSLGPNWLCITRNNNTQTTIDSGVEADNGYNRFRIIVNSPGTEARFFINEVLVATSTTNIPNSSARLSGIALNMQKLIGTAQANVYIDYYYHKITIPGGRD